MRVADETFFQTAPFFAVKVLPRFGIAAVDKAVDIVAYQADIDVQALLRQSVAASPSRMAWAKRCWYWAEISGCTAVFLSGTRLIVGNFGDLGFEFGKRREIKIAFQ
ncbi:Uncharacterised protein [Neisseria meningitidis]|nr:Uncharacterised protein [Neisseria meningitidis]